jgi:hypothetical protein
MYRAHWQHFVSISFAVFVLLALLTLLLALLLGVVGVIAGWFISIAGVFWLQGALVEAVADVRDGRADLSIGETISRVRPRVNVLALAGILAVIAIGVGLVLLVVPGLLLLTWWVLIVPVIVLERVGVRDAFGRSRELVRGNGWNVFGVIVLTVALYIAGWITVSLALFWLPDGLQGFLTNIVGSTLTAPIVAISWTLMYYRLRGEPEPAAA